MKMKLGRSAFAFALCAIFFASCESTGNLADNQNSHIQPPEGYVLIENSRLLSLPNSSRYSADSTFDGINVKILKNDAWEDFEYPEWIGGRRPLVYIVATSTGYVGVSWSSSTWSGSKKWSFIVAIPIDDFIPNFFDVNEDKFIIDDMHHNFWDYVVLKGTDYGYQIEIVYTPKMTRYISVKKEINQSYKTESFAYALNDSGSIKITAYLGKSTDTVTIPANIDGISVNEIESMQSLLQETFKKVVIPRTVVTIDDGAFQSCGIEILEFEKNSQLKKIGKDSFKGNQLSSFSVPRNALEIGNEAFVDNKIKKISIPAVWFFADSTRIMPNSDVLEEVVFEEGCKSIPRRAFEGCNNLKRVYLPKTMSKINDYAFSACKSLSEIVFPNGVGKLKAGGGDWLGVSVGCFYGCPLSIKTKATLLEAGLTNSAFE